MQRFSERNGYVKQVIHAPETMTGGLRNRLWNVIDTSIDYSKMDEVSAYLWHQFYKLPLDSRGIRDNYNGKDWSVAWAFIKREFMNGAWYAPYDLIEYLVAPKYLSAAMINRELAAEAAPYRLVDGHIVQITDESELREIESAINEQDIFAVSSHHVRTALRLLSDRTHPDFRNSIKESISAVEAVGKALTGTNKGTLDDALRALSKSPLYVPALLEGFRKIYGWSSDQQGIRHSLKEAPTVDYSEAKFFLVACSAFANYLKAVGQVQSADNHGES